MHGAADLAQSRDHHVDGQRDGGLDEGDAGDEFAEAHARMGDGVRGGLGGLAEGGGVGVHRLGLDGRTRAAEQDHAEKGGDGEHGAAEEEHMRVGRRAALAEDGENEGLRDEADGRGGEERQSADRGEAGREVEQDVAADRHQAQREGGDEGLRREGRVDFGQDFAEAAADEFLADGAGPDEVQATGQHLAAERDGGAVPGAEGVAGDEGRDLARQADGGEQGGEEQEHRRAANAALGDEGAQGVLGGGSAQQRQSGDHRDHPACHQEGF